MPFYYTRAKIITNKKAFGAATARKLFCITYIMFLQVSRVLGRFFKFSAKNLRSVAVLAWESGAKEKIKKEQDSILQKCTLCGGQPFDDKAFWKSLDTPFPIPKRYLASISPQ